MTDTYLVVTRDWAAHAKGDLITDPTEIVSVTTDRPSLVVPVLTSGFMPPVPNLPLLLRSGSPVFLRSGAQLVLR